MNAEEIAQGWVGSRVDDVYGAKVGKVKGAYLDRESLQPLWLIVRLGIVAQYVAIPVAEASAGGGRVWVPYERAQIRTSPHIVTSRPMSPWHELDLCQHYNIPLTRGARGSAWERRSCTFAVGDMRDSGVQEAVAATDRFQLERRRDLVTSQIAS
jgi:PRC-barrel domain protein